MSSTPKSTPYSLPALLELIKISDAYKALTSAEQQNIQDHIKQNNTPVLIYIFKKLQEEQQSYQISRDQLAKKILKLSLSPADQQNIKKALSNPFQK